MFRTKSAKTYWIVGFFSLTIGLTGCNMPKIAKLSPDVSPQMAKPTNEMEITKDGFLPQDIEVAVGQKVIFKNTDRAPHTIASDPHPTHDILPNLYSTPIFKDQTYEYTFKKAGAFGIHLEDNPSISGKIVVK